MKHCSKCNTDKPLDQFHKKGKTSHGTEQRNAYCKECLKGRRQKNYKNPYSARSRYNYYKRNAKNKELPFPLTFEQFCSITSLPCSYCGDFSHETKFTGIDRIDPNVGYTTENCVPCCSQCNYMKLDYTTEEFISKAIKIASFNGVRINLAKEDTRGVYKRGNIYWIRYSVNGKQIFESTKSGDLIFASKLLSIKKGLAFKASLLRSMQPASESPLTDAST